MKKSVLILTMIAAFSTAMVATSCRNQKKDGDQMENKMDNDHADNTEGHLKNAAEKTGDAVKKAGKKTGEAVGDAAEDVGDAVDDATDDN